MWGKHRHHRRGLRSHLDLRRDFRAIVRFRQLRHGLQPQQYEPGRQEVGQQRERPLGRLLGHAARHGRDLHRAGACRPRGRARWLQFRQSRRLPRSLCAARQSGEYPQHSDRRQFPDHLRPQHPSVDQPRAQTYRHVSRSRHHRLRHRAPGIGQRRLQGACRRPFMGSLRSGPGATPRTRVAPLSDRCHHHQGGQSLRWRHLRRGADRSRRRGGDGDRHRRRSLALLLGEELPLDHSCGVGCRTYARRALGRLPVRQVHDPGAHEVDLQHDGDAGRAVDGRLGCGDGCDQRSDGLSARSGEGDDVLPARRHPALIGPCARLSGGQRDHEPQLRSQSARLCGQLPRSWPRCQPHSLTC
ncbi:hypothetical protein Hhel01_02531 [Haloferula helveola]